MMKKFFLATFAVLTFVACSNDKDPVTPEPETPEYEVMGFEAAELGVDGFIWGKEQATEQEELDFNGKPMTSMIYYGSVYEEGKAQFYTYFSDYGGSYDTWNAFIVSNHTDCKTEGYTNDKSVYAQSGAAGSKQFAVGLYGAWTPDGKGTPTVRFTSPVKVGSVEVANATYAYYYFRNDITTALKPDFKLVVTGYNGETKTGETSWMLVSGTTIRTGWEMLDLTALGTVTRLDFTIACEDVNAPLYFCIDNLSYEK